MSIDSPSLCFIVRYTALLLLLLRAISSAQSAELSVQVEYKPEDCNIVSEIGDEVDIHYTGYLENGQIFDSSVKRDKGPIRFILGARQVIEGWDKGLRDMCIGERRRLVIPPEFGYGDAGYPPAIPPRATLVFDTNLVSLKKLQNGSPFTEFLYRFLRFGLPPLIVGYAFYYMYQKYNKDVLQAKDLRKKGKKRR